MIYLNEQDILKIGTNWEETIDTIEKTVRCLNDKDYAQPIKPYLRYSDLINRIIAMPAFVGGDIDPSLSVVPDVALTVVGSQVCSRMR